MLLCAPENSVPECHTADVLLATDYRFLHRTDYGFLHRRGGPPSPTRRAQGAAALIRGRGTRHSRGLAAQQPHPFLLSFNGSGEAPPGLEPPNPLVVDNSSAATGGELYLAVLPVVCAAAARPEAPRLIPNASFQAVGASGHALDQPSAKALAAKHTEASTR